jgi:CBS domain containing-hemolysin-like protein
MVSAAEVGFFSLSPTDLKSLEESDSKSSKHIFKQLSNPKQLLATLLITQNFVLVGVVILSSYVITEFIDKSISPNLVFFLEVIGVTCVILIVAEILPKIYASLHPLKLAKALVFPITVLSNLYRYIGLSTLLIRSTSIINNKIKQRGYELNVDELSHALELTSKEEVKAEDRRILKGIVKFGNIEVRQIMKSRMDVDVIEHGSTFHEVLRKI